MPRGVPPPPGRFSIGAATIAPLRRQSERIAGDARGLPSLCLKLDQGIFRGHSERSAAGYYWYVRGIAVSDSYKEASMPFDLPANHNQPPPGIHEQADQERIKQAQEAQKRQQEQEAAERKRMLEAEMRRRAEETSQGI